MPRKSRERDHVADIADSGTVLGIGRLENASQNPNRVAARTMIVSSRENKQNEK